MTGPAVAWTVTGALTVGTVVLGALAISTSSELARVRGAPATRQQLDELASRGKGLAVGADIGGAVSIAMAAVSIGVTVVALSPKPKKAGRGAPSVRVGLGHIGVEGAF
jgi:hypothetical protein